MHRPIGILDYGFDQSSGEKIVKDDLSIILVLYISIMYSMVGKLRPSRGSIECRRVQVTANDYSNQGQYVYR